MKTGRAVPPSLHSGGGRHGGSQHLPTSSGSAYGPSGRAHRNNYQPPHVAKLTPPKPVIIVVNSSLGKSENEKQPRSSGTSRQGWGNQNRCEDSGQCTATVVNESPGGLAAVLRSEPKVCDSRNDTIGSKKNSVEANLGNTHRRSSEDSMSSPFPSLVAVTERELQASEQQKALTEVRRLRQKSKIGNQGLDSKKSSPDALPCEKFDQHHQKKMEEDDSSSDAPAAESLTAALLPSMTSAPSITVRSGPHQQLLGADTMRGPVNPWHSSQPAGKDVEVVSSLPGVRSGVNAFPGLDEAADLIAMQGKEDAKVKRGKFKDAKKKSEGSFASPLETTCGMEKDSLAGFLKPLRWMETKAENEGNAFTAQSPESSHHRLSSYREDYSYAIPPPPAAPEVKVDTSGVLSQFVTSRPGQKLTRPLRPLARDLPPLVDTGISTRGHQIDVTPPPPPPPTPLLSHKFPLKRPVLGDQSDIPGRESPNFRSDTDSFTQLNDLKSRLSLIGSNPKWRDSDTGADTSNVPPPPPAVVPSGLYIKGGHTNVTRQCSVESLSTHKDDVKSNVLRQMVSIPPPPPLRPTTMSIRKPIVIGLGEEELRLKIEQKKKEEELRLKMQEEASRRKLEELEERLRQLPPDTAGTITHVPDTLPSLEKARNRDDESDVVSVDVAAMNGQRHSQKDEPLATASPRGITQGPLKALLNVTHTRVSVVSDDASLAARGSSQGSKANTWRSLHANNGEMLELKDFACQATPQQKLGTGKGYDEYHVRWVELRNKRSSHVCSRASLPTEGASLDERSVYSSNFREWLAQTEDRVNAHDNVDTIGKNRSCASESPSASNDFEAPKPDEFDSGKLSSSQRLRTCPSQSSAEKKTTLGIDGTSDTTLLSSKSGRPAQQSSEGRNFSGKWRNVSNDCLSNSKQDISEMLSDSSRDLSQKFEESSSHSDSRSYEHEKKKCVSDASNGKLAVTSGLFLEALDAATCDLDAQLPQRETHVNSQQSDSLFEPLQDTSIPKMVTHADKRDACTPLDNGYCARRTSIHHHSSEMRPTPLDGETAENLSVRFDGLLDPSQAVVGPASDCQPQKAYQDESTFIMTESYGNTSTTPLASMPHQAPNFMFTRSSVPHQMAAAPFSNTFVNQRRPYVFNSVFATLPYGSAATVSPTTPSNPTQGLDNPPSSHTSLPQTIQHRHMQIADSVKQAFLHASYPQLLPSATGITQAEEQFSMHHKQMLGVLESGGNGAEIAPEIAEIWERTAQQAEKAPRSGQEPISPLTRLKLDSAQKKISTRTSSKNFPTSSQFAMTSESHRNLEAASCNTAASQNQSSIHGHSVTACHRGKEKLCHEDVFAGQRLGRNKGAFPRENSANLFKYDPQEPCQQIYPSAKNAVRQPEVAHNQLVYGSEEIGFKPPNSYLNTTSPAPNLANKSFDLIEGSNYVTRRNDLHLSSGTHQREVSSRSLVWFVPGGNNPEGERKPSVNCSASLQTSLLSLQGHRAGFPQYFSAETLEGHRKEAHTRPMYVVVPNGSETLPSHKSYSSPVQHFPDDRYDFSDKSNGPRYCNNVQAGEPEKCGAHSSLEQRRHHLLTLSHRESDSNSSYSRHCEKGDLHQGLNARLPAASALESPYVNQEFRMGPAANSRELQRYGLPKSPIYHRKYCISPRTRDCSHGGASVVSSFSTNGNYSQLSQHSSQQFQMPIAPPQSYSQDIVTASTNYCDPSRRQHTTR